MLYDENIQRDFEPAILRYIYRFRKLLSWNNRKRLNEKIKFVLGDAKFTIISNNCLAGVFYHDAGRQFTSPTVNLAFDGEEFVRFCENMDHYLFESSFQFKESGYAPYPVANLDDIEIRFVHYKTNAECVESWDKRKLRIDWEHLFVVATDVDGLNREDLLERFDKLKFKNKIMFTSKKLPQYKWAVTVPQFTGRFQVRIMTQIANCKGQRYYETCFDIPKWIRENN